eukprot:scaffold60985_cov39-Tisochrysis_lutea.AAC.2
MEEDEDVLFKMYAATMHAKIKRYALAQRACKTLPLGVRLLGEGSEALERAGHGRRPIFAAQGDEEGMLPVPLPPHSAHTWRCFSSAPCTQDRIDPANNAPTDLQVRLLMRREKTMKICANFFVAPTIELKVNAGSDRSWVWQCHDFSEEKTDVTILAIRFANSENAQKFKEEFEKAKKANEGKIDDGASIEKSKAEPEEKGKEDSPKEEAAKEEAAKKEEDA